MYQVIASNTSIKTLEALTNEVNRKFQIDNPSSENLGSMLFNFKGIKIDQENNNILCKTKPVAKIIEKFCRNKKFKSVNRVAVVNAASLI